MLKGGVEPNILSSSSSHLIDCVAFIDEKHWKLLLGVLINRIQAKYKQITWLLEENVICECNHTPSHSYLNICTTIESITIVAISYPNLSHRNTSDSKLHAYRTLHLFAGNGCSYKRPETVT